MSNGLIRDSRDSLNFMIFPDVQTASSRGSNSPPYNQRCSFPLFFSTFLMSFGPKMVVFMD